MRKEQRPAITTTLYDLISILHTQVGVEDDQMITAMVTYLLRTRQIRCIKPTPAGRPIRLPRYIPWSHHRSQDTQESACPLCIPRKTSASQW